jgi:RNA polymerase sigma-70 factor (ECF subfamily)
MSRPPAAARDAVSDLYASCYRRLVGVITLAAPSQAEAEECVQEAFLRVLSRWDHVSRLDSPEAWVRTVAFNLLSNRRRKARNAIRALLRHGPPAAAPPPNADRVDVTHAMRRLPLGQRQTVVMHHVIGLSIEEIAQALKIAPGTVKSRLSRARATLAATLREETTHA